LTPTSTLFPYTTLFRSVPGAARAAGAGGSAGGNGLAPLSDGAVRLVVEHDGCDELRGGGAGVGDAARAGDDRGWPQRAAGGLFRSEEHTSELQSQSNLV